ncbi:endonuclease/exonuclease/phosphatase family protein [Blastomonas sp.]|uniref:endonuclease/exonuclease/phosphatase family protein n=1 Tax=Blastomonas sp. TaxID=1909299 RepID=UPI002627D9E1|nr:endonuclease/exonuclease/phosphatase family protein [Blastomonas sp.]MDM7956722.1 endonuclease/exonuclease/phosphatase family protein [Blastomonas sp.]
MLRTLVIVLAAIAATGTTLSLLTSYRWYIRMWDFPRVALIVFAALALVLAIPVLAGWTRSLVVVAMLLVIGWQGLRIYPYTPLAKPEVAQAVISKENCISAFSFNVLQTNRDYARTISLIDREDPDIVLLLETDGPWEAALKPVIDRYPHRFSAPLDNLYGLIMLSRLPVEDAEITWLIDKETPSVFATLQTNGGSRFRYIGLHPRPPQPGEDTEKRDGEIAIAARHAKLTKLPVLAMGDFNDVAWSRTSQMFKRIGGYLDPRVGRGLYATFPANLPGLRWPLDHIFMSPDFTLLDMKVLENVGSDHLPVIAKVCLAPRAAKVLNDEPETPDADDHKDMHDAIRDGKEAAQKEGTASGGAPPPP